MLHESMQSIKSCQQLILIVFRLLPGSAIANFITQQPFTQIGTIPSSLPLLVPNSSATWSRGDGLGLPEAVFCTLPSETFDRHWMLNVLTNLDINKPLLLLLLLISSLLLLLLLLLIIILRKLLLLQLILWEQTTTCCQRSHRVLDNDNL